jgi:hypothetical protein
VVYIGAYDLLNDLKAQALGLGLIHIAKIYLKAVICSGIAKESGSVPVKTMKITTVPLIIHACSFGKAGGLLIPAFMQSAGGYPEGIAFEAPAKGKPIDSGLGVRIVVMIVTHYSILVMSISAGSKEEDVILAAKGTILLTTTLMGTSLKTAPFWTALVPSTVPPVVKS